MSPALRQDPIQRFSKFRVLQSLLEPEAAPLCSCTMAAPPPPLYKTLTKSSNPRSHKLKLQFKSDLNNDSDYGYGYIITIRVILRRTYPGFREIAPANHLSFARDLSLTHATVWPNVRVTYKVPDYWRLNLKYLLTDIRFIVRIQEGLLITKIEHTF